MLGFDQAVESTSGKIGKLLDAHSGGENGSNGWKNWDVHKDPTKKIEDYSSNCKFFFQHGLGDLFKKIRLLDRIFYS